MSKTGSVILGVLVSGRGSNLQAIIDAIEAGKLSARIGVVLSDKKDAQALARARRHEIPSFFVDPSHYPNRNLYDAELARRLKANQAQLVVLAGYMRLLTTQLINACRDCIINIHPSLLPAFPGLHAQRQALSHGVKVSGCTVHFVDEEVDHGPIIAQAAVSISERDTETSLSERILQEEHRLLPKVIQIYAEGRLRIDGRRVHIEAKSPLEEGMPHAKGNL